jgi:hypothetical protein
MDNIIKRDDVTPDIMQHIQRLASTLNNDPMSVAAVDFDTLRTFTNGFEPNLVVLLLVRIAKNNVREYLRDNIFDAMRMDNELMTEEMRENEQRLESRLKEMWRHVIVRLRYEEKYKERRDDALRVMLGEKRESEEKPFVEESPMKCDGTHIAPVHISLSVTQSQGDDKRRIEMSGDKANYSETQIHNDYAKKNTYDRQQCQVRRKARSRHRGRRP